MADKYLKRILNARVYDVAKETPLEVASKLSRRFDNQILLKREDLQPVFSFKLRGAYNKIFQMHRRSPLTKVVSASAGNHAQGVALAAQRLGLKAVIVMPRTTPQIKIDAVRALGAKVVLQGDSYDEASEYANALVEREGAAYIPPYDDPDIIAGQGTVAAEILRQAQLDVDAVFVPVGGGGLVAGVAAYIKAVNPSIKVIGVEPVDAPSLYQALEKGRRVKLKQVGIFADGVAVRQVGKEPFRLARQYVDEVVLVSTDEICAAIKDIFDDTRSIAEPSGAVATAGAKKYAVEKGLSGKNLVAIVSGANMNFDRLRHIAERAEIGERREMVLGVTIPERPGSFKQFCTILGKHNITEFNYRYADNHRAHVFAGIEVGSDEEARQAMLAKLAENGYEVTDLSDNEMAKLHTRYMVGGRPREDHRERLFRFEFPERPGALQRFLNTLGSRWNISLFHYRNHGAAYGRVLVGLQVDKADDKHLLQYLDKIGYEYCDETANQAYKLFMS